MPGLCGTAPRKGCPPGGTRSAAPADRHAQRSEHGAVGLAASAAGQPGREAMRHHHHHHHHRISEKRPCPATGDSPCRQDGRRLEGPAEPGRAKRARGPARPPGRNQVLAEGGRAQHGAPGDADSERKRAWPRACPSGADVRPARRPGRCASREPGNRAQRFRIGRGRAQRRSPVGAAKPGRASASTWPGEAARAQSGAGGGRTCAARRPKAMRTASECEHGREPVPPGRTCVQHDAPGDAHRASRATGRRSSGPEAIERSEDLRLGRPSRGERQRARGPARPPGRNQVLAEGGRAQHDAPRRCGQRANASMAASLSLRGGRASSTTPRAMRIARAWQQGAGVPDRRRSSAAKISGWGGQAGASVSEHVARRGRQGATRCWRRADVRSTTPQGDADSERMRAWPRAFVRPTAKRAAPAGAARDGRRQPPVSGGRQSSGKSSKW